MNNYIIRNEKESDFKSISALTLAAFETLEISNHTEQFIIEELRKNNALTISLVAELGNRIIGHIAFSPIKISGGTMNWFGLGPVSVLPEYQKKGIGKELIDQGLTDLRKLRAGGCCLIGHPEYYRKFGFKNPKELEFKGVPSKVFFALSFDEKSCRGEVHLDEAFTRSYANRTVENDSW